MTRFGMCCLLGLLPIATACSNDPSSVVDSQSDSTEDATSSPDSSDIADSSRNDAVDDGTVADSTEPTNLGDADGSVSIPDLGLGGDQGQGGDTTSQASLVDKGELPYDVRVEDTISAVEAGHRYLLNAVSGMEASITVEAGGTLAAQATLSGPLVDGSTDTIIRTISVAPESSESMAIEITADGFYWLTIEADTPGTYSVEVACSDGCDAPVGVCPELASAVRPPLGSLLALQEDLEVVIVDQRDGRSFVDTYQPAGTFEQSLMVDPEVRGLEAIRVAADQPPVSAILLFASIELASFDGGGESTVLLPEEAFDLTAVQWIRSGVDDLAVVEADGGFRFVSWDDEGDATVSEFGFGLGDIQPIDLTSGDLDGDGVRELILAYETDDSPMLLIAERVDDDLRARVYSLSKEVSACAAGDMDADTRAEIICSHTGFFGSDDLTVYRRDDEASLIRVVGPWDTSGSAIESIAVGDTDHDGVATAFALDSDDTVREYALNDADLEQVAYFEPDATTNPEILALADTDNNSPRARLLEGPFVSHTDVVPNLVLIVPPAWSGSSDYWASAGLSESESSETREEASVSLNASVSIGYKGAVPQLFSASVTGKISRTITRTIKQWTSLRQGITFSIESGPEQDQLGAVMMSWTCYDAYSYALEDPSGILGGPELQEITVNVPRHIGRVMWAVERYNRRAPELGLTSIAVGVEAGDPSSYPTRLESVFGSSLDREALVTPDPYVLGVSDSIRVSGFYEYSTEDWNTGETSTGFNLTANTTAAGVTVEAAIGVTGSSSHTLRIGNTTKFTFGVGPVVDDPDTPLDEYDRYSYQFSPFVYREDSDDGAFFALYHYVSGLGPGYD